MARRSTFENANILFVLEQREIIDENRRDELLNKLDHLCRKITNFQKTLKSL